MADLQALCAQQEVFGAQFKRSRAQQDARAVESALERLYGKGR